MIANPSPDRLIPDEILTVDLALLERAKLAPAIAIDTETSNTWKGIGPEKDLGLSYIADVLIVSLAWMEHGDPVSMAIPIYDNQFPDELVGALNFIYENRLFIGHNTVFDIRQISKYLSKAITPDSFAMIYPDQVWDTMVMERLLNPGIGAHNKFYDLLSVARAHKIGFPDFMEKMKKERKDLVLSEATLQYAQADSVLALQIYEAQNQLITDETSYTLAEIECQAVREYGRMAAEGVKLNIPYVQERITDLSRLAKALSQKLQIDGLAMPGSPSSRIRWIYQKKAIPVPAYQLGSPLFTAKGHSILYGNPNAQVEIEHLSGSTDAMDELMQDDQYPELQALKDYLHVDRMIATLQSLLEHAALDGRVHSLIAPLTETGRRKSSNPNIQNLPMQEDATNPAGTLCGVLVGSTPDHTLIEIDYSNAENWGGALISADSNFAAACNSADFHSAMAAGYFPDEWQASENDTPENKAKRKQLRRTGKSVTFGTAYGMGSAKLAARLGVTKLEAEKILAAKDRAFPKVKTAKESASLKAETTGFIQLWTKRKVPVSKAQTYVAWNYLCQGLVGELVKRSIILISEEYRKLGLQSRTAIDMHDAIILDVYLPEAAQALAIAQNVMEHIIPDALNQRTDPPIRWIAEPNVEENSHKWGKCQSVPELENHSAPGNLTALISTIPKTLDGNDSQIEKSLESPILVRFDDLGFEYQLQVRPNTKPSQYTPEERQAVAGLANALWETLDRAYTVFLPYVNTGSEESGITRQETQVDLAAWCKVPALWLMAYQKSGMSFDLPTLTGYTGEQLIAEHTKRSAILEKLDSRIDWCLKLFQIGKGE